MAGGELVQADTITTEKSHTAPEATRGFSPYVAIGDYAIIGNCRTAALVSHHGSIDWLCLPRFDSPSVFGALLDAGDGGRFSITPTGTFRTERRYVGATNVLETTFVTPSGRVRLRDLMPVASEEEKRTQLWPDHEIFRVIDGLEGEVEIQVRYDPRPEYGLVVPSLVDHGALGIVCEHRGRTLALRSNTPLRRLGAVGGMGTRAVLRAGDQIQFSLVFSQHSPAILPPLGAAAEARIHQSIRWWEDWAARCRYEGPYRSAVLRSALVLKLLTFAPSGAIIAAPTTSLPEAIGGCRNWDYRYCWLRDASMTLRVLLDLGYRGEGDAFFSWLLHATRLTWPELQVLYDVYGETRLAERELPHFEGYAGSAPVRVGNAAADQFQLDVYGEVVDAAHGYVMRGGRLDHVTSRTLVGLGETVCQRWREPDRGIWELRSGRRHHTYSKAMCWVALDRLIALASQGYLHARAPLDVFVAERDRIRDVVETHGYSARLNSYVHVLGTEEVDASLLLLGVYNYLDPANPRMRHTCTRVHKRLGVDSLLYRYLDVDDGLPAGEGAFGIASFWAVECRARGGDVADATAAFEEVCRRANDVGLFAEEIDPATGAALGNFPQAFTHVGLISAAQTLRKLEETAVQPAQRSCASMTDASRALPALAQAVQGGGHC